MGPDIDAILLTIRMLRLQTWKINEEPILHYLARNNVAGNYEDQIVELIKLGFNIDEKNARGLTPLQVLLASFSFDVHAAMLLIELGANATVKAHGTQSTFMHRFVALGADTILEFDEWIAGHIPRSQVNEVDLSGYSAYQYFLNQKHTLSSADENNFIAAALRLVANGADVNAGNSIVGDTVLHLLMQMNVSRDDLWIYASFLVNNCNADVNSKNNLGLTPLAQLLRLSFVMFKASILLSLGADKNTLCMDHKTTVERLLQSRQVDLNQRVDPPGSSVVQYEISMFMQDIAFQTAPVRPNNSEFDLILDFDDEASSDSPGFGFN